MKHSKHLSADIAGKQDSARLSPNLPVPSLGPTLEPSAGAERNAMTDFFCEDGLASLVGARLLVEPEPSRAAEAVADVVGDKRRALGWDEVVEVVAS